MEERTAADESDQAKQTASIDIPRTQPSASQPSSDPSTPPSQIRHSFSARRSFGPRGVLDRLPLPSAPFVASAFSPHSLHTALPALREPPPVSHGMVESVFRPPHATMFPDNHTVYDYWHAGVCTE